MVHRAARVGKLLREPFCRSGIEWCQRRQTQEKARMDARATTFENALSVQAEDPRPTREAAEAAVRTLIRWAGDDPSREGLRETPGRVLGAYEEWFRGYREEPEEVLDRTFSETAGYRDMVLLRDIKFVSHCEHHMAPITGHAHVAYLPRDRVVGISKLARLVEVFARRLQIQERLTSEIAAALETSLKPRGVAVMIVASHGCMTTRGVHKDDALLTTTAMLGAFEHDESRRREFLAAASGGSRPQG
jgi:GTP cyclohydrolase I